MVNLVEQICNLKKDRKNTYTGDTDDLIELHVRNNIDQFEYIEEKDRVVAYIEWYKGIPIYDEKGQLKRVQKDDHSIYIANIVANSAKQILIMGRKILRWNPEANFLYWSDHRFGGRNVKFPITEEWRS